MFGVLNHRGQTHNNIIIIILCVIRNISFRTQRYHMHSEHPWQYVIAYTFYCFRKHYSVILAIALSCMAKDLLVVIIYTLSVRLGLD